MSNTTSVKPLRYAASLIFACHTPIHQNASSIQQDFKILFMTRNKKGSFAGLTVFPGGAVEACDADPSWIPTSLPHHHHTPRNMKSNSYQTAITAIRETFEETGILLTHTIDQSLLESTTRPVIAHMDRVTRLAWRDKVHHDPTLFKHLCKSTQTYPSLNRLVYWDKWVTPKLEPVRFDTDFYLAAINDPMESLQYMQLAEADGQEATSISWMTPIEALNKFKKKEISMLPPQYFTLKELASMTFHQLYNAIKDINFNRPIISKLPERIGSSHRGNPVFRIPRTLPQSTHHETEADFYYVEFIVEKKVIVDLIEVSLHDIKDAKL